MPGACGDCMTQMIDDAIGCTRGGVGDPTHCRGFPDKTLRTSSIEREYAGKSAGTRASESLIAFSNASANRWCWFYHLMSISESHALIFVSRQPRTTDHDQSTVTEMAVLSCSPGDPEGGCDPESATLRYPRPGDYT